MDPGRLIFDSSTHGHMLVLDGGNSIFRGARSVLGMEEATNKRRPFFMTSPEELLEEEYYDDQLPEKKRRLSPEQVHLLEKSFESENKLEPERKSELAKKLGLQARQVAVWFQNRRARSKTKQLESDFDRLKAAYDSLLADHEFISKDNDRLRSQVITLTEKLQSKEPVGLDDQVTSLEVQAKVEVDHLSMGSGGSAVVDGEGPHEQINADSSGDSYFHIDMVEAPSNGGRVHSEEEEDGSDDASNYVPIGMFTESQHVDNWWVWS